ncbi:MAG: Ig-like domain-containing protein [Gallionella sp.]|nr:Ig-like domain-containing protein [Gallionella sp.]
MFNSAEINAYLADTPSRDLADKSYAVDTAALYELWNDPRRVAGGRVTGLQGRLAFAPLPGAAFKLGAGGERQEYDYLTGKQSTTRATGSAEWVQCLAGGYQIKAGADAAAQNRYSLGLERSMDGGGLFGASFTGIRGKNGAPHDNQLKLTWSYTFDSKRTTPNRCGNAAQAWGNLLDQVAQRPGFLPAQVVARLDTSAAPVRQIAVDKTALPAGSSVNTVTGAITTPLGIVATGIAGVTLNAAPFANTGQFALSGNSLVIDPSQIIQPAVGVIDTYVVTVNIFGGGTSLVTVVVSRGSVKIDSITVGAGGADLTAPTTSAGPSVSGTTDIATTLSATLNENGTGYYLVQAFAAAAPNVAAVLAGTSFAMTAGVAATPAIGGLTAGTAYKIYFVAKDAANNVQAAVQSVAVTTDAVPTANNFTYGTNIDNTAKTFDWKVLSAAADADGDPLTATVQAQGAKGSFVVAGDNVTYTASANQTGSDSGTLRISDGRGGVKDITVTVNGIDTQAPAAPVLVGAWWIFAGGDTVEFNNVGGGTLSIPADADLAAWYLSESTTAPATGAAGWNGAKPTSYIFPVPPGSGSTATVCVYVKDTLGNVQQTGACDSYLVP